MSSPTLGEIRPQPATPAAVSFNPAAPAALRHPEPPAVCLLMECLHGRFPLSRFQPPVSVATDPATPAAVPALNPAGIKAALACIDGHIDGLRQAIAPAVANRPAGDHPAIWLSGHLALAAYEIEECRHVAELLEGGMSTTDQEARHG